MNIKVSHKNFMKLSRLSSDTNPDWNQRHKCWIARQVILALAGKDCNNDIKKLVIDND